MLFLQVNHISIQYDLSYPLMTYTRNYYARGCTWIRHVPYCIYCSSGDLLFLYLHLDLMVMSPNIDTVRILIRRRVGDTFVYIKAMSYQQEIIKEWLMRRAWWLFTRGPWSHLKQNCWSPVRKWLIFKHKSFWKS